MSDSQSSSGRPAAKHRFTRSGGRAALVSATVVYRFLPRWTPVMPSAAMSRSTRPRPTAMSSWRNATHIRRAP
jgi:hypothetical protein